MGSLEARVWASNKERVHGLVHPNRILMAKLGMIQATCEIDCGKTHMRPSGADTRRFLHTHHLHCRMAPDTESPVFQSSHQLHQGEWLLNGHFSSPHPRLGGCETRNSCKMISDYGRENRRLVTDELVEFEK